MIETCKAQRVIDAFGGVPRLARYLKEAGYDVSNATVYRWTYPKSRQGTGGTIPARWAKPLKTLAELYGVEVADRDLAPW